MAGGLRPASKGRFALAIWLVVSALLWAAPAQGQPPATNEPRVSGPLYLAGLSCGDNKLKHEGKVLAKVASCVRLYEYDTLMETDVNRSFGVAWVQTTVDPMNGWCATKVRTEVILPGSVNRLGRAPNRLISRSKPGKARIKISTTADDTGLEEGSVSQDVNLYPRSLKPSLAKSGRIVRTEWNGQESRELAFVSAAEISWDVLATPEIRGGLGKMLFLKGRGC